MTGYRDAEMRIALLDTDCESGCEHEHEASAWITKHGPIEDLVADLQTMLADPNKKRMICYAEVGYWKDLEEGITCNGDE